MSVLGLDVFENTFGPIMDFKCLDDFLYKPFMVSLEEIFIISRTLLNGLLLNRLAKVAQW